MGEVQHKEPRVFASQLGRVFSECSRVLKEDGVLAFRFHHSRAEGWAAICEAVTSAGLAIVAAHPVHAEFRGASPKSAAKSPISLDAILVCRKRHRSDTDSAANYDVVAMADSLAKRLERAGMSISEADRVVIFASQMLIPLSKQASDFETARKVIQRSCLERQREV